MQDYVLTDDDLARLQCPLLVLHGTPDRVFLIENARALFDGAASDDKTFLEWADGDHCIYNHSHEKHVLVGDWLADHLAAAPLHGKAPFDPAAPTSEEV